MLMVYMALRRLDTHPPAVHGPFSWFCHIISYALRRWALIMSIAIWMHLRHVVQVTFRSWNSCCVFLLNPCRLPSKKCPALVWCSMILSGWRMAVHIPGSDHWRSAPSKHRHHLGLHCGSVSGKCGWFFVANLQSKGWTCDRIEFAKVDMV